MIGEFICTDHWWAIEGDKWTCALCGTTEAATPPNVVDKFEIALRIISAGEIGANEMQQIASDAIGD